MKEEHMPEEKSATPKTSAREKTEMEKVREEIPAGHQVVVLSNRPDLPLLVSDAEHLDLERQGLVLESTKEGAVLRSQKEGE